MFDAELLYDQCAVHLDRIRKLFKPHCFVTLIMRNPQSDDGDLFIGNDTEPEKVIASIRKTCKLAEAANAGKDEVSK